MTEKEQAENYCLNCIFRRERWHYVKGKLVPLVHNPKCFISNKKGFCILGYTQNPKTLEATQNAERSRAEICPTNNFRRR